MLKLFYKKRETDEDLSRMAWDLLETACLKEGILHPRDRIIYGKNGKPYLEGNGLYFNLSHSGDYALCVLCDTEVGCDIQKVRKPKASVIDRWFSTQEKDYILGGGSEGDRAERFTRIWALKESYIKQTGEGLSRDLRSFCFAFEGEEPVLYLLSDSGTERVSGLAFYEQKLDGYACVCCFKKQLTSL